MSSAGASVEGQEDNLCTHGAFFPIEGTAQYDDLKKMSVSEIRKKYPRMEGTCPFCGWTGIAYASYAQMIFGDY